VTNCLVFPLIKTKNKDCETKNIVYKITCKLCNQIYIGEACRTAHFRIGEHLRYATYPETPSNVDEAFAIHYTTYHRGKSPKLECEFLSYESNTVRRKISEAMYIVKLKPTINKRDELETIKRFLIDNDT